MNSSQKFSMPDMQFVVVAMCMLQCGCCNVVVAMRLVCLQCSWTLQKKEHSLSCCAPSFAKSKTHAQLLQLRQPHARSTPVRALSLIQTLPRLVLSSDIRHLSCNCCSQYYPPGPNMSTLTVFTLKQERKQYICCKAPCKQLLHQEAARACCPRTATSQGDLGQ